MKSRINPRAVINTKIIGYCIDESKKNTLMSIALDMNIDLCFVGPGSIDETLGYVAGINGLAKSNYNKENTEKCEILILSGMKSSAIDNLLKAMRENNVTVELKCVITPTNQNWTIRKLIDELAKEHEAMHKNK